MIPLNYNNIWGWVCLYMGPSVEIHRPKLLRPSFTKGRVDQIPCGTFTNYKSPKSWRYCHGNICCRTAPTCWAGVKIYYTVTVKHQLKLIEIHRKYCTRTLCLVSLNSCLRLQYKRLHIVKVTIDICLFCCFLRPTTLKFLSFAD